MRTDVDNIIFCMTSNNVVADRGARPEDAERVAVPAIENACDQVQSRVDSDW
jgi:hypothetical protein